MSHAALALALVAPLAAGCSTQRLVARAMAGTLPALTEAFEAETSPAQAREAGPALLKMLDGLIAMDPRNPGLLVAGSRMYASFAFAFLEEEDPARARLLYERARGYARRALERDPRPVAARFWAAAAWAGSIHMAKSDPHVLKDLPKALALLEEVLAEDEGFQNAAPHLFLGIYHASRGPAVGGDPRQARAHFERALELTGRRLLQVQLHYARGYAVQVQDAPLFRALLTEVLEAPDDLWPEQALANALAKERARRLLAAIDDLIIARSGD